MIGIYKITSPSGKIYIGQSRNIEKRFKTYNLLWCKPQRFLYNSFLKHGVKNHKFEIIEVCSVELLDEREIYYVNLYDTFNSNHGLNLKEGGGSNAKLSENTKLKLREINLGRKHTDNTKLKMSEHWKIRRLIPVKEETRLKNRLRMLGNKRTLGKITKNETKIKLSKVGMGNKRDPHTIETKKLLSSIHKGKKLNKETIDKMIKAKNRKIIDTKTGIVYASAKLASIAAGYSDAAFRRIIRGERNNNTTFKILDNEQI